MNSKLLNSIAIFALLFSIVSCDSDDEPTKQDLISNNLTTSKTAYENAADGSWVTITGPEYDSLADNLTNVSTGGMGSNDFTNSSIGIFSSGDVFVALTGTGANTIPEKSYLFAFKYVRNGNRDSKNAQVKLSYTNSSSGFTNLGNPLPTETGTATSTHYYVLKANDILTDSVAYVGFYTKGRALGFGSIAGLSTNFSFGDSTVNSTTSNSSSDVLYQTLSTTDKQW